MQREISRACRKIVVLAVAEALVVPSLATAQQPHAAAVGDLMTALVQPRHIKLGLAGSEQNWAYAAYELDQLRETFADLADILPKYRDLSIPEMITSTVKEPLAALDRAIQAQDIKQFTAAYCQLTASCNTCHQSYDRAVIVIQVPHPRFLVRISVRLRNGRPRTPFLQFARWAPVDVSAVAAEQLHDS